MPIVARSRMLVALLALLALPAAADEPAPPPEPPAVANTLKLDLQVSGVAAGWTVAVKPANPGSRFETVVRRVEQSDGGPVQLDEIALDARSLGADRYCALSIVLTDPEGTSQTFKRSVRLLPQPDADTIPEVSKTFYLRTGTVASRDRDRPN